MRTRYRYPFVGGGALDAPHSDRYRHPSVQGRVLTLPLTIHTKSPPHPGQCH